MNTTQPEAEKKYFTLDEANRMLPLVRAIVQDITTLYQSLTERAQLSQELSDEMDRDEDRLHECLDELNKLGVEFKGFDMGLVDFPCWQDGREICLCWKLGEPAIDFWHETWAGFAGS